MDIKRGDIFYADLNPVIGSEQGGYRPVVIIQNNIGNMYSPTVIVIPITSSGTKSNLPTHQKLVKTKFLLDDSRNNFVQHTLYEVIRIAADIKLLEEFGIDVITIKSTQNKYFIGNRKFELPEIKLLIDAVESSKFITPQKSEELIKKLV